VRSQPVSSSCTPSSPAVWVAKGRCGEGRVVAGRDPIEAAIARDDHAGCYRSGEPTSECWGRCWGRGVRARSPQNQAGLAHQRNWIAPGNASSSPARSMRNRRKAEVFLVERSAWRASWRCMSQMYPDVPRPGNSSPGPGRDSGGWCSLLARANSSLVVSLENSARTSGEDVGAGSDKALKWLNHAPCSYAK
jgi:hypothetical protein